MEYLAKQAGLYGYNIEVIFGRFGKVSHYNIINHKSNSVIAKIYNTNKAYWLQREDNFMCGLHNRKEILIIK